MNTPVTPHEEAGAFLPFLRFWGLPASAASAMAVARGAPSTPLTMRKLHLAPRIRERLPGRPEYVMGPMPSVLPVGDGEEVLAWAEQDWARVPAVAIREGRAAFGFDPGRVVEGCLLETGRMPGPPITRLLPLHYHRVPGAVRLALGRLALKLSRPAAFPRCPLDDFVEGLRCLVLEAALLVRNDLRVKPFWPDGAECMAALCHDVDDAAGLEFIETTREIERRFGRVSTFFLPTHHYDVPRSLVEGLRQEGCEVAAHGWNHDNRLAWLPPGRIDERLKSIGARLDEWGGGGFRSPSKCRSEALLERLGRYVSYDSSCPDTDGFGGCGTVFPFRRGALLEIPMTMPLDADILLRGGTPGDVLEAWQRKLGYIRHLGGVAVVTTHPEPHFGASRTMLCTYEDFLCELSGSKGVRFGTMQQVAEIWGARERAITEGIPS